MKAKFQKQLKELTYLYVASSMAFWKSYLDEPLISMGFTFTSPLEYAARFLFNKSNDPIFIEYTNVPNRFSMLMGLGFNVDGILDDVADIESPIGVSLGVGANLFFNGEGDLEFLSASRMAMHMPWDAGVIAGILIRPCETLCDNEILKSIKVGVSYNQGMEMKMDFNMKVEDEAIAIWSYDSYSPDQLRFGLSVDPLENLIVALEVTRVGWSNFKPPFWIAENKPERSGMLYMVLGDVFLPAEYDAFYDKFNNIWVPRVGVEYSLLDDLLKLRGGYFFRLSPVPDQTQETNFIDCDTHAVSFGSGYTILDNISVSIHGQWRMLVEREMKKDDRDATITGSGNAWNTGITLSVDL
ncbi:MAG: outer membrane protein transport protein [Deltaproteobacteria bacterium]|nr:MAG: outer membrane protein transport protein [Deltaproteobacteria bacterium]